MALSSPGLWRARWLLVLLLLLAGGVETEPNRSYKVDSVCKNHFLQRQYRKIDGAVLRSQNERNLDCVITFQTHSILQRFMLRFDLLLLDCNDHLFVYDGANPVGNYKADLSCRNTKENVGTILMQTNFVTLKYVTDAWGTESNGFKLIITAFKEPKHVCWDFSCTLQEFCISKDLVCDEINHCGDGSDEALSADCTHLAKTMIFGMNMTAFIVVVSSIAVLLCAVFTSLAVCLHRRVRLPPTVQQPPANTYPLQQTFGSNGAPLEKPPPYPGATCVYPPGNMFRPAASLGYSVHQVHLFYPAK